MQEILRVKRHAITLLISFGFLCISNSAFGDNLSQLCEANGGAWVNGVCTTSTLSEDKYCVASGRIWTGSACIAPEQIEQFQSKKEADCSARGGTPVREGYGVSCIGGSPIVREGSDPNAQCGNLDQPACGPSNTPRGSPGGTGGGSQSGGKTADDKNKTAGQTDPNKQPGKDTVPVANGDEAPTADTADLSATSKTLAEEADKCIKSKRDAQSCCRDPMSCLVGRENPEVSASISTLLGLVGTGAAVAIGAQQGGNDAGMQACKALNLLGYGSAGINGLAAGTCTTKKLSCESTCGDIREKAEKLVKAHCADTRGTGNNTCRRLKQAVLTASVSIQECGYLNAEVQQLAGQSIAGGTGAAISSLCNSLSAASVGFASLDRPPVFNGDCNANPNNPACVNCADPKFATNPMCQKTTPPPVALGDGGAGLSKANYGNGTGTGTANVAGLEGTAQQQPVTPNVPIEPNRNAGIGGGGGSGGMGSAAAQPGNDNQQGGQGGGPGVNADIMQGTVGGNGFSGYGGPAVQTGGGSEGFSGYGGGNGAAKQPGFSLAQFLPGGARAAAGRGLASANIGRKLASELGNVKDNIWMRYSRRMLLVCARVKCEAR